ncbi:MAG: hypothetical protein ABW067_02700 [Rhizobacter sp.]|jgi:hypothetical protein
MKLVQNTVPTPFTANPRPIARWTRSKLVPRRTLPTLTHIHVGGGLLDKLAWLLGRR